MRSVKVKALQRAVRVQFRLSEPATVTIRVKRRLAQGAQVGAGPGARRHAHRDASQQRLRKGRYTIEIQARDAFGNRSSLAAKRLTLRK